MLIQKQEKVAMKMQKNVNHIVKYINSLETKITFLNLFRLDVNDDDLVVQVINEISSNQLRVIDLKAHYRKKHLLGGFNGTKDGIHPTIDAIHHISKLVCKLVV